MQLFDMKQISILMLFKALFTFMPAMANADIELPVLYLQHVDEARYLYRTDMEQLTWRQIREQRRVNRTANQDTKWFRLRAWEWETTSASPPHQYDELLTTAVSVMRDPNGKVHRLSALKNEQALQIPDDDNLVGRYLVGTHIVLDKQDVDGDGLEESVHLCPKHIVSHYKNGGQRGSASVVFFNDAKHMPLEIGPAINTAKSKFGGGAQRPHRNYEMMVKYLNKPLPGANVTVMVNGSQWKKSLVTDENGMFDIMPTDDRSTPGEWQKYLYTAAYHDRRNDCYYMTTLPIVVRRNTPEWRTKSVGFTYWAIAGSAGILLVVWGFVLRKNRLKKNAMTIFQNHRIKKDRS
jgi:hypothetical protein